MASRFYAPTGAQGAGEAIQALLLQKEEQDRRDRLEATRRQEVVSAAQRDQQRIDLQRTRDAQDAAKQQQEQDKYARERTDAAAKIAIENNLHPDAPITQDAANTVGSSGLYGSFLKRGTLPSTTQVGSLPGPAISQGMDAATPDAAPAAPPSVPGVLSGPVRQAGGDNFLRATPGQQKVLDEQKALADLVADPAVANDPQVKLILNTVKATGDTPGAYAAIAAIIDNRNKPDTRSLQLRANDALLKGDTAEYNRLLKVIKDTGQADDRPRSEPALIKTESYDPNTGQTTVEYKTRDEVRNQTFRKGPGATTANRLDSAQAVNQTGDDIVRELSDPAFANTVGVALGRFNTLRDFIGNPPPEFAQLAGQIESYAIANMGVHGMRSVQGADQIKSLLDKHHTPASLMATVKGLNDFSRHFMENLGRGQTPATPAPGGGNNPPPAAGEAEYDTTGRRIK